MGNTRFFVVGAILLILVPGFLHGAIPASERAALIAFYNATNGDKWTYNYGWKSQPLEPDGFGPIGSEGTWRGINVQEDHVVSISMNSNNLTGSIPPEIGNLRSLRYLDLSVNDLTGPLPPAIGTLGDIYTLNLSGNQLTGSIPPELGNLSNLHIFSLHWNQLTGSIPPELGNLDKLERLELSGNQLTGGIPPELGNLSHLENLSLGRNLLTIIPPELGNLDNLEYLYLSNNPLVSIPPELGNMDNLEYLDLEETQLTQIPPELGNLSNLRHLELPNNNLTDIPPELGNLDNLTWLDLRSNQLTNIPPGLGNLDNLLVLYLDNNQLTSIPPEIGNLSTLESLHLEGNKISAFPPELMSPPLSWGLDISYNAIHTNDELLRIFLDGKDAEWEDTQTVAPTEIFASAVESNSIRIAWTPIKYTGDIGRYMVYYGTSFTGPWVYAGMTPDKSTTSYTVTGLDMEATYYFIIQTQTDPHEDNPNTLISDASGTAYLGSGTVGPFGSFDTPVTGSTVYSSIPVTGWALDDLGVAHVKIYRQDDGSEKLVYIGDADFVEGARPDIESAYPDYPNNQRAGWGYMLLTNFLPNGGNGTFTLYAIATDIEGNHTTLGTKIIVCDNAHALKPFGAIDTPAQGGTASGGSYRNNGWVLTPMPNKIPVDGSTINVYVDGVYLGHPVYNVYRSDISGLFPGYANSSGAWAYLDFDTTVYTNGVHTIYWTAEDDAGNADGIGSRYFVIQNANGRRGASAWHPASSQLPNLSRSSVLPDISDIPVDYSSPVGLITGYNRDAEPQIIYPNDNGIITIEITELERIEIELVAEATRGLAPLYSTVPLPIGSTLDTENGIFYWSPGPGFIGAYRLVFIEKQRNGEMRKIPVEIMVQKKGY